jgi:hypothetical protein
MIHRESWVVLALSVLILFGAILATLLRPEPTWNGPRGKVTQKMWTQEFWQAGERLYPARWCLELNYRDEVCVPESDWNKIAIGDWYGAK